MVSIPPRRPAALTAAAAALTAAAAALAAAAAAAAAASGVAPRVACGAGRELSADLAGEIQGGCGGDMGRYGEICREI